jgi:hypothetical protein
MKRVVVGGRGLHSVMVIVIVKVFEGGMEMMTPWEDELLDEDDDGWGQEEEEAEEEEEHPLQQDHVDVTNLVDLHNRSVTQK